MSLHLPRQVREERPYPHAGESGNVLDLVEMGVKMA